MAGEFIILEDPDSKKDPQGWTREDCKGRIYKGKVEYYIMPSNGSYCCKYKMVPMRKLSCKGCEFCDYLDEYLSEFIGNETPPITENIQENSLYSLKITNESTDWETGYVDDFDLEFVELKQTRKS